MQYPIDEAKYIASYEAMYGPAKEKVREMFRIHVKLVNEAYEAGCAEGRKEAVK